MRPLNGILLMLCAVPSLAQSLSPAAEQHVRAAQQAQTTQDCHRAAIEYGEAARLTPRSGELRSNEGVALYCDEQLGKAVASFKAALRLDGQLAAPHLFLGLASYRLDDEATAERELRRFLSLRPEDQTAHLWLGYTLTAQQNFAAATAEFAEVVNTQPDNVDARYALGESYLQLGREKARALERVAPGGARMLQLASEQYRLMGDEARANAALEEAKKHAKEGEPGGAGAQELALYQEAREAETSAQKAFEAVMTKAPDSYRAHQITADSLLLMQKDRAALAEYRVVAALNPKLPAIHEAMSNCLMLEGKFKDALQELREEESLQPQSATVAMEMGRAELAMGHEADAAASLREALRRHHPPAETYLLLGRAALQDDHAAEAVAAFEQYITQEPASSNAYYLLARAYRRSGNNEGSEKAMATYQRLKQEPVAHQLTRTLTQDPKLVAAQLADPELNDKNAPPEHHP